MSTFNEKLTEIVERDPRYAQEAYEFIYQALYHTQQLLGRVPPEGKPLDPADQRWHVSGPELLRGICALALQEFGGLARTVFHRWGINKTADWGHIVFNLIENELMSKTSEDSVKDFTDVFDLDQALADGFKIELESE
jgi:uncharacterized repeat protein (TIGR04138 family)